MANLVLVTAYAKHANDQDGESPLTWKTMEDHLNTNSSRFLNTLAHRGEVLFTDAFKIWAANSFAWNPAGTSVSTVAALKKAGYFVDQSTMSILVNVFPPPPLALPGSRNLVEYWIDECRRMAKDAAHTTPM